MASALLKWLLQNTSVPNGWKSMSSLKPLVVKADLEVQEQNKEQSMKIFLTLVLSLLFTVSFAQDNLEDIKAMSQEACECISKIDTTLSDEEKSEEISSCISSADMAFQLQKKLFKTTEKVIDTLDKIEDLTKIDSITINGDKNIIITNENYDEIEEYLYENCLALKDIYFSNNQANDKSYSDRKKAMELYEKGVIAFQNQQYEKAIPFFSKAVKKDKNFAFAWDNLGYSYRKLDNYKKAVECYKKSLEIDPMGKMPLMNMAVAYQLDNDLDNALRAYQNYAKLYPDDPEAYYGLGRTYIFMENYEKALENTIKSYILYSNMNSPYKLDAEKHISIIYAEMEKQGKLDLFYQIAKENNLTIETED